MTPNDDTDSIQIVPDPDKLDRYHRQQLSAMLDGELSPDQARFMLRRLQHDAELAGRWERWQVCGDVLRGQRNALLPADFARRVSAAIANDGQAQVLQPRARAAGPRLLRWGGGAALAASVAMAALLVGRQAGIEPDQRAPQVLPELAASGGPAPAPAAADPSPGPSLADASALLAGAALVAAETPRRADARRAADGENRVAANPRPVAVATRAASSRPASNADGVASPSSRGRPQADTSAAMFAGAAQPRDGIGTDPFAALPMTVASRPWPQASLGGAAGYSVGFGDTLRPASTWIQQGAGGELAVAELFGLPAGTVPRPPAATAIGAHAVGAGPAPELAPGDAGTAADPR